MAMFFTGWEKGGIDDALCQYINPDATTEFFDEGFLLHQIVPIEADHSHIAVNANEHHEEDAAVKMNTEKRDLNVTQKTAKWPDGIICKVHSNHDGGWSGKSIAQGQVELQNGARVPVADTAAEDPQTENVEAESYKEDQGEDHSERDVLRVNSAV